MRVLCTSNLRHILKEPAIEKMKNPQQAKTTYYYVIQYVSRIYFCYFLAAIQDARQAERERIRNKLATDDL